jgi:hypothetical protein
VRFRKRSSRPESSVEEQVEPLNEAEQEWVATNVAEVTRMLDGKLSAETLDDLWAALLKEEPADPNPAINMVGLAFGQLLADRLGLSWVALRTNTAPRSPYAVAPISRCFLRTSLRSATNNERRTSSLSPTTRWCRPPSRSVKQTARSRSGCPPKLNVILGVVVASGERRRLGRRRLTRFSECRLLLIFECCVAAAVRDRRA